MTSRVYGFAFVFAAGLVHTNNNGSDWRDKRSKHKEELTMYKLTLKAILPLVITSVAFLASQSAVAATAIFLEFPDGQGGLDIKGDSQTQGYVDMIDVLSWGWGVSNNATVVGGTITPGTLNLQAITVIKSLDTASSPIYERILKQTIHSHAVLHITNLATAPCPGSSTPYELMTVDMEDAVVASNSMGIDNATDIPSESLSFVYRRVCITTITKDASGTCETQPTVCYVAP